MHSRDSHLRRSLATAAFLLVLPASALAALEFHPPVVYPAGSSVTEIVLGDLTGDARPEAVSLSEAGPVVLLNAGDGTFMTGSTILGFVPKAAAIGRVDADGFGDLMCLVRIPGDSLAATTSLVKLFHSEGDGTLTLSSEVTFDGSGQDLALGDVDGDLDLDLVVSGMRYVPSYEAVVAVYTNDGTGFGAAQIFLSTLADELRLIDFNSDSKLDIVIGRTRVYKLDGAGDGTFAVPVLLFQGYGEIAMPADFDADGDLDFAINDATGATIHLNDGAGNFLAGPRAEFYAYSRTLFAGDLDSDGLPDVCTASHDLNRVSAFRGDGAGSFILPVLYFSVTETPTFVTAADLDGDGLLDLITANQSSPSSSMTVLIGGFYGACGRKDYASAPGNTGVAVADFNHDGFQDVVSATQDHAAVVLLNDGSNKLVKLKRYAAGTLCQSVAAGDFNGDQYPDFAVADYSESRVSIYLNQSGTDFSGPTLAGVGSGPRFVIAVDVHNDGYLDLVTANYGDSYAPGSVSVLRGNGDGTFRTPVDYPAGVGPYEVRAGKLNADDLVDLVITNYDGRTVTVYLNNGNGTFGHRKDYSNFWNLSAALADLDHDGDVDVATCNFKENTVSVLANDGAGNLSLLHVVNAGPNPRSIAASILKGDGDLDLAVVLGGNSQLALLANDGAGDFVVDGTCATGVNPHSLAVMDIDRNGGLDLLTGNAGGGGVTVLSDVAPALSYVSSVHARHPYGPMGAPEDASDRLDPVSPNPARGDPSIAFHLARPSAIELSVFDVAGRLMKRLVSSGLEAGGHRIVWDRTDERGARARAGIYFVKMRAAASEYSRTLVLAN